MESAALVESILVRRMHSKSDFGCCHVAFALRVEINDMEKFS